MNNTDKLVSIVVPVFNRHQIIRETIDSVLNQTYQNWELIIVDDGSTDNTLSIVQQTSATEKRIKIFKREKQPKGAPACRNIGLSKASGEYVIFLDSDDLLLYNCLENRIREFEKNQACDLIIFNGAFFTNTIHDATVLWNTFDDRDDLQRFLKGEVVWSISGPIWKVKFLKQNSIKFDETAPSSQDWEFHVRALLKKPVYINFSSMPDYFIRRNITYQNISDGHWTKNKILTRVKLYENIIDKELRDTKPEYTSSLVVTILKEYNYLLLKKINFKAQNLVALKKKLRKASWDVKLGIFYILTGNKLLNLNFQVFKLFRKVCDILFLKKIFNNYSNYRTLMSENEIQNLNNILHSKEIKNHATNFN